MTIVSTTQDRESLTLTIVTQFAAPPARVWQIWSDPRQLERWWGPPTWPATFQEHDLVVGAVTRYCMTPAPTAQESATTATSEQVTHEPAYGLWRILTVQEPTLLEFEDAFADEAGQPNRKLPTTLARVDLEAALGGTRMTITSTFTTAEQLEQLIEMGMIEGLTAALGQIEAILATG